jgi:hypothetical protein
MPLRAAWLRLANAKRVFSLHLQGIVMSKKVVRVKNYFSRRWFAVIAGSCVALTSMQAAQAAGERREAFQNFRNENPELARREARQAFNQQFRLGGDNTAPGAANFHHIIANPAAAINVPTNHSAREARVMREPRVSNQSVQTVNDQTVRLNTGIDLDLSSTVKNITLGQKLFDGVSSVEITVGGETKTVQAGSQVSAAEYVAVKQVLGGGTQQIGLDSAGRANGGQFDLASLTNPGDKMRASNFVLPENVTTYGDFSRSSEIRLVGDLDNYGSIYAIASNKRANSGTIHADDITNHAGALISSNVPKDMGRDLNASARKVNLGLDASSDLINYGTISSSGNLSLSAGSGNVTNTGTIESKSGDVSFNGPADTVLNVNNTGGQIVANHGAINVRDAEYAGSSNTYVKGGDLLSRNLNTNAGQGVTYVDVNQLTGDINQTGNAAHVEASTDVLNLGNICLTGDPTYRNTAGSISITGNITVAEDLTIVASQDIAVSAGVTITAGDAASGHNITLIAGADILGAIGGADSGTLPPLPATTTLLTLSGNASATGGSIALGTNVSINSRSTGVGNAVGGDVLIAAFRGNVNGKGTINAGNASILTGGRGTGANGDVEVIAGASNGTAVSLELINTTGGTGGSGDVFIVTAEPVSGDGGVIQYNATGQLVTGSIEASNTLTATASAAIENITSAANVSVRAGNLLGTASSTNISAVGSVGLFAGGSITLNSNISASNIAISAGNNLSFGTILSTTIPAGVIIMNAGGTLTVSGAAVAQSDLTLTAGTLIMSGAGVLSSANGDVNIDTTGNIIGSTSSLVAAVNGALNVSSANGNIGANAGLRFRIDADTLNATAFSGSIFVSDLNTLDVTTATASSKIDLLSVDLMSVSGLISADQINLQSSGDAIAVNADVSAGTSATLKANTDLVSNATARVIAPQVSLTATSADIVGGPSLPFRVNADNIVVSAPLGSAIIGDPDSLNFGGGNTFVGSSLVAVASGIVSNSSIITGTSVALASTGASVSINNTINGSTSVILQSADSISNANVAGNINTPFLTLASTGGDVGSSTLAFTTNAARIAAASLTGSVYINDTNPVVTKVSGTSAVSFNFTGAGSVNVDGTLDGNAGVVNIIAGTDITSVGVVGTSIISDTVNLTAGGNIGASLASDVILDAQNVSLTAGSGIFVTDVSATAVTLNQAISTDTLDFDATNADLVSTANFSQNEIFLKTDGVFNFSGNLQNDGFVALTSGGDLTNAQFTGTIKTNALGLASTGGNVGTSTGSPFVVADGMATIIRANSTLNNVFLQTDSLDAIALTDSTTNLDFNLEAAGPITVIGDVTSNNGNVNIENFSGALTFLSGADIRAFDQINLINSGTNKKTSKIIFEANTSVLTTAKTAGQGNVLIQLGAPQSKVVTKAPKNTVIVETGADVTILGKSLKAVGPVNTLTATGGNLTISNGLNAKNLTLGGSVELTADPPVAPGTPTTVTVGRTTGGDVAYALNLQSSSSAPNAMPARNGSFSNINLIPVDYARNIGSQTGSMVNRLPLEDSSAGSRSGDDSGFVWTESKAIRKPRTVAMNK